MITATGDAALELLSFSDIGVRFRLLQKQNVKPELKPCQGSYKMFYEGDRRRYKIKIISKASKLILWSHLKFILFYQVKQCRRVSQIR